MLIMGKVAWISKFFAAKYLLIPLFYDLFEILSHLLLFFSDFFFFALAKISSSVLKRIIERRYFCLFPDFRMKAHGLSPLIMVTVTDVL